VEKRDSVLVSHRGGDAQQQTRPRTTAMLKKRFVGEERASKQLILLLLQQRIWSLCWAKYYAANELQSNHESRLGSARTSADPHTRGIGTHHLDPLASLFDTRRTRALCDMVFVLSKPAAKIARILDAAKHPGTAPSSKLLFQRVNKKRP
jgi:hypothetical protein